jgi:hypothetical protein
MGGVEEQWAGGPLPIGGGGAILTPVAEDGDMLYLIAKAVLSGIIVAVASEVARRSPSWGALILSLPLLSILSMLWLWRDTGDSERIAALAQGTFWLVLPTLPLFLVLPALLRHGVAFWAAIIASCLLTVALYLLTVWLLPKLGINL